MTRLAIETGHDRHVGSVEIMAKPTRLLDERDLTPEGSIQISRRAH